jgi:hypothetical protein
MVVFACVTLGALARLTRLRVVREQRGLADAPASWTAATRGERSRIRRVVNAGQVPDPDDLRLARIHARDVLFATRDLGAKAAAGVAAAAVVAASFWIFVRAPLEAHVVIAAIVAGPALVFLPFGIKRERVRRARAEAFLARIGDSRAPETTL